MREIKFRGKRIDNGEWVYGFYTYYQGVHYIIVPLCFSEGCSECGTPFGDWHMVNGDTVGQYVGLQDVSGEDIYEGDILINNFRDNKPTGVIQYVNNMFTYSYAIRITLNEDRKIGNIHDNPELLKL